MGQRGPAPKPTELKLIQGNPGKVAAHRLNDALRPKVEIPDCPAYLLPEARKEWHRITPELKKLHIISQLDLATLAAYCQAYATWANMQKKLKKLGDDGLIDETPSGYKQISVWMQISNRAADQMHKFLCEFGMSPASRTRISANVCTNMDIFEDVPSTEPEKDKVNHGPGRFFNN